MHFKQLTLENWTDPDPVNKAFGRLSRVAGVGPRQMTGSDWARSFLAVELKEHVPEDIRELFAVARGAMLYGWFFYPLFLLGEQQIYRVVETATKTRYAELGGPRRKPSFHEAIEWLTECQVIPAEDTEGWHASRKHRNAASHLEHQSVIKPGTVLRAHKVCAHDINRLFAREVGGVPRST